MEAFVVFNFNKDKANVKNISINLDDFIHALFYDISDDNIIRCWKNHLPQRADIFIRIRQAIKDISIKKGIKNFAHAERLSDFINFLDELRVPNNIVKKYLMYHNGITYLMKSLKT